MATRRPTFKPAARATVQRDQSRDYVRRNLARAVERERSIVKLARQLSRETKKADEALGEIVNSVRAAADLTRAFFEPVDRPASEGRSSVQAASH